MTPSGMFACVQMILFGTLLLRVPSVVNAFTIHSGARNFIISGEHEGRFVQHENSGSRINIRNERMNSPKFLSSTSTGDETNENEEALPEPASMRIRAIKDELNDAGVSFSDCFDKDSLVERLVDARSGKVTGTKKEDKDASAPPATSEENTQNTSSATKEKVSTFDKDSFAAELRSKKVRELRTLCAKNNIRWANMIEKSELVNALVKHQEKAADFSPSGKLTPGKVSMIDDDILSQEVAPGAAVTPLLLDVFAEWCGPCKMMAPFLDEAASELGDKVRVAKIDSDQYPEWAGKLQVKGLPTVIVFDGNTGKEFERVEGALMKDQLVQLAMKYV